MGFIITCCNTTQTQNSKAINTISAPLVTNLPVCLLLILCPSEKIYTAACASSYRTEFPAGSRCHHASGNHQGMMCHNRLSHTAVLWGKKKNQNKTERSKRTPKAADQRWEYISQRSNPFSQLNLESEINKLSSTMSYSLAQQLYPLHLASSTPKGRRKKKKSSMIPNKGVLGQTKNSFGREAG